VIKIQLGLLLLLGSFIQANAASGHGTITTEQLLTQIYNFTLLFGLLFFLLKKPIVTGLASKRAEFLKQKDVSQNQLKAAKDSLREISDRISLLEKNFNADLERAKSEAQTFKSQQTTAAKQASERIAVEAKKNLGYEQAKYVDLIKEELLELATTKAKASLKQNLKSTDQKRLQTESFVRFQEVRP